MNFTHRRVQKEKNPDFLAGCPSCILCYTLDDLPFGLSMKKKTSEHWNHKRRGSFTSCKTR